MAHLETLQFFSNSLICELFFFLVIKWALLQSNDGKYVGASAWLNIIGLQGVKGDQFSETAITLINGIYGPSQNYNVIKVGWMVSTFKFDPLRLTICLLLL